MNHQQLQQHHDIASEQIILWKLGLGSIFGSFANTLSILIS